MARYALLLRGVNVGTKNSLPMQTLRALLEDVGCTDVRTLLQSGNAVFATTRSAAEVTKAVEAALARTMGRAIATTLRTRKELQAVVDDNPFPRMTGTPSNLCVTFLSIAPTSAEVAALHAADFGPERFHVSGKEIYTWHPAGQGRSPLAAALDKLKLKGAVTRRNWRTVLALLEMIR